MLSSRVIHQALRDAGVGFFCGVPDSSLADFCAYLSDHAGSSKYIISTNEGSAIALAAGYHLGTNEIPLVFLQNSGQGNAVNPLVSLADPEVYSIPMLLLIGWRGEPGKPDEPQHIKQGKITLALLETLGIPYQILPISEDAATAAIEKAVVTAQGVPSPYALVVKRGSFSPYRPRARPSSPYPMSREEAVKILVDHLNRIDHLIVSTTGKTSRELFEYRAFLGQEPGRDFLTVGSMGHASQIALGLALAKPDRQICCFDGDGSLLMHLGSVAIIGSRRPGNFKHFVLNNGAHDSVGGQPTVGFEIDIPAVARACGYRYAARANSPQELEAEIERVRALPGPTLLEIRVKPGARADLGRPDTTPLENKHTFIRFVRS